MPLSMTGGCLFFCRLCNGRECAVKIEVQKTANGDIDWMFGSDRPLVRELYCKLRYQGVRPNTIVVYTSEPFIFRAGNAAFLLEVKWDEYLPDL